MGLRGRSRKLRLGFGREIVKERVVEGGFLRLGEGCRRRQRFGRGRGALWADGLDGGTAGGGTGELGEELTKFLLDGLQVARVDRLGDAVDAELGVACGGAELGFEGLAGAGDGVALVVKQGLDPQGHLNIAAAVKALAGAALVGLELGKLALPKTQNVGRDLAQLGYFADAEVELVGDLAASAGGRTLRIGSWWAMDCTQYRGARG